MKAHRPILFLQLPLPLMGVDGKPPLPALGPATLAAHGSRLGASCAIAPPETLRGANAALADWIVDEDPSAVALTCTVWNVERSLELCHRLRARKPERPIWLGGPEVAGDAPWFPGVSDLVQARVQGPGELFLSSLANVHPPTSSHPRTTSHLPIGFHPQANRHMPVCPHREGWIDADVDGAVATEWHRGCDRTCSYCRYGANHDRSWTDRSAEDLTDFFRWARSRSLSRIYVLDPSFASRPDRDEFLAFLARINRGPALPLAVELRPEEVDAALARTLRRAGVDEVELGVQTLGERARRLTGRPLDRSALLKGLRALRNEGFRMTTDLMVGLPGDGAEDFEANLDLVEEEDLVDGLHVHRTQVLPGTRLRRDADRLGLLVDPTPPYFVRATPDWPEELLAGALARAEERLGISFLVNENLLPLPPGLHRRNGAGPRSPGPSFWDLASWDLDHPDERERFRRETFRLMAHRVLIHLRSARAGDGLDEMLRGLIRLRDAAPFAMVTLVVEIDGDSPLGPLQRLATWRSDEERGNAYGDRFWAPFTSTLRPSMRMVLLVDGADSPSSAWLEAAEEDFEVLLVDDLGRGSHPFRDDTAERDECHRKITM